MWDTIVRTLQDTWAGYVAGLSVMIPRLLATATVVLGGWLIAAAARAVSGRLLRALRFPRFAERSGLAELLRKAELPPADRLAAALVFWLLFLGFLLAGLEALGFEALSELREQLVVLVPRLVAAAAILGIGLVLANVVWRMVVLAAVNAGWPRARATGRLVHVLLVTLACAMALDHLGVARGVVVTAFALVFGAVLLAAAIAVGVAAVPLVRRALEERLAARSRPEDGSSHL